MAAKKIVLEGEDAMADTFEDLDGARQCRGLGIGAGLLLPSSYRRCFRIPLRPIYDAGSDDCKKKKGKSGMTAPYANLSSPMPTTIIPLSASAPAFLDDKGIGLGS